MQKRVKKKDKEMSRALEDVEMVRGDGKRGRARFSIVTPLTIDKDGRQGGSVGREKKAEQEGKTSA